MGGIPRVENKKWQNKNFPAERDNARARRDTHIGRGKLSLSVMKKHPSRKGHGASPTSSRSVTTGAHDNGRTRGIFPANRAIPPAREQDSKRERDGEMRQTEERRRLAPLGQTRSS